MNLLSSFWLKPPDFYFLSPFPSQHQAGALPPPQPDAEHPGAAGRGLQPARAPSAAPWAQPVPPACRWCRRSGAGGCCRKRPGSEMGLGNTAPQQGCSGQPLFLPCHLLSFKYEIWHLITGSDDSEVSHNAVIKPKVCIH